MRVKSVEYHELKKVFRLANKTRLPAHKFCCLGPGDDVVVTGKRAHARCRNGKAQILPSYCSSASVKIGTRIVPLVVKEIETEQELAGYHRLEECHYRGKVLHGRRVPLIICSNDPLLPMVLGYVELATAFIMNRPRAQLLSAAFYSPIGNIHWTEWKKAASREPN